MSLFFLKKQLCFLCLIDIWVAREPGCKEQGEAAWVLIPTGTFPDKVTCASLLTSGRSVLSYKMEIVLNLQYRFEAAMQSTLEDAQ